MLSIRGEGKAPTWERLLLLLLLLLQTFNGPLSGTTWKSRYQKKHSPAHVRAPTWWYMPPSRFYGAGGRQQREMHRQSGSMPPQCDHDPFRDSLSSMLWSALTPNLKSLCSPTTKIWKAMQNVESQVVWGGLGVTLGKLLTPTGLAGCCGLVLAYLAVGEKPPSVHLSRQLLWYAVLGTGCSTFPAVPRSTQPSTLRGTVKWVLVNARGKVERVTSVGWQVTLCDPIWHLSSALEVCLRDALYKSTFTLLYFALLHRRSLAMSPFGTAHINSYSTLTETMHLSCTAFNALDGVTPFEFRQELEWEIYSPWAITWHCLHDPMSSCFYTISACDGHTHSHDDIYCASKASHGKNHIYTIA